MWYVPIVSVIQEAEAGELLESPQRQRLQLDEIMSPYDRAGFCLKEIKKKKVKRISKWMDE